MHISDLAFSFLVFCVTFPEITRPCRHLLSRHLSNALIDTTHKLSDAAEAITMYLTSGQQCGKWGAIYFELHFYR